MKITALNPLNTLAFPLADREAAAPAPQAQDVVSLSAVQLLQDHEVDSVLGQSISLIAQDSVGALSVHSGLSQSRVFALLGM